MSAPDIAEKFRPGAWEFTPEVVDVFDEHVRQSVPFYDAIQALIAEVSDWLLPAGGLIADLGASTGTTIATVLDRHPERNIRAALYDDQAAMLDQARARLLERKVAPNRVTFHTRKIDAGPLDHEQADLTTILFTLQFLPAGARREALTTARKCSAESGALIVAEKIRPVDARWAEIATDVSHDWKEQHGITADAIRAKARALRGVLVPGTFCDLYELIRDAGWYTPEVLFRWHQWVVIGAFAAPLDGGE